MIPWKVSFFFRCLIIYIPRELYNLEPENILENEVSFGSHIQVSSYVSRKATPATYLKSWKVAPVAHTLSCLIMPPDEGHQTLGSGYPHFFWKTSPRTSRVAPTRWRTNSCLRSSYAKWHKTDAPKRKVLSLVHCWELLFFQICFAGWMKAVLQ